MGEMVNSEIFFTKKVLFCNGVFFLFLLVLLNSVPVPLNENSQHMSALSQVFRNLEPIRDHPHYLEILR